MKLMSVTVNHYKNYKDPRRYILPSRVFLQESQTKWLARSLTDMPKYALYTSHILLHDLTENFLAFVLIDCPHTKQNAFAECLQLLEVIFKNRIEST